MCDDYFEDDFGDDFGDDGFMDEPCDENLPGDDPLQEDTPDAAESDEHYGPDWGIIFPIAEDIAREKRERDRIKKDMFDDGDLIP